MNRRGTEAQRKSRGVREYGSVGVWECGRSLPSSHTPTLAYLLLLCVSVSLCLRGSAALDAPLPAAVTALAYSPDGSRLAVGTFGQVVLYDTKTWQPVASFTKVEDSARALAFRPDGKALAIGCGLTSRDGVVVLWDLADPAAGKTLAETPPQADAVESVAFRKDGALLLGADDNKACYYDALPKKDHTVLDEHNGRVQAVAFSPKPDWVFATGGLDKIVKVWDEKTRKAVVNFDQSEAGITGLAFLPNGVQLVGSSEDGRLYWWGIYYNQKQKAFGGYPYRHEEAHEGGVNALGISADGKRLVTGGEDNVVSVWDADNGRRVKDLKDSTAPIYAVALSPDGKTAVGAGREGVVRVWTVDDGKLAQTLTLPPLPKTGTKKQE